MVNGAVKASLAEDAEDLGAFSASKSDKSLSFDTFVQGLKRRGRIYAFDQGLGCKEIEALGTKADRQRVVQRIQQLAVDPRTLGSEKLAGHADRYRARRGQYRIIYLIDDGRREGTIFKVGQRKDVYR